MSRLADWLGAHAPGHARAHPPGAAQRRAIAAIASCRTPARGGRIYRCGQCAKSDFAYHSCHHRSCPRCGGNRTADWTHRQCARLLPVPYFMVTFTVPAALRALFVVEPKIMINLLFQQAADSLQQIARQPRHLGAELGMIGVLHTWGRQMQYHPHLHFIVPGGGLRADRRKWRRSRRPDWLLPATALAGRFRTGMREALAQCLPAYHARVPEACWRSPWVVDIRHVGRGEAAVKYLARYVSRTAISDERIVSMDDSAVRFSYRDSATNQAKLCTLEADEFLRRYLQHVLPDGVHRVRYFGWEHPAAHRRRRRIETLLEVAIIVREPPEPLRWHLQCPHCHAFALVCVGTLAKHPRAPPSFRAA